MRVLSYARHYPTPPPASSQRGRFVDHCRYDVPFADRPGAQKLMAEILPGDVVEFAGLIAIGPLPAVFVVCDLLFAASVAEVRILLRSEEPLILTPALMKEFVQAIEGIASFGRSSKSEAITEGLRASGKRTGCRAGVGKKWNRRGDVVDDRRQASAVATVIELHEQGLSKIRIWSELLKRKVRRIICTKRYGKLEEDHREWTVSAIDAVIRVHKARKTGAAE